MRLERLTLKDFRSYQDADIDLSGVQLASVVGPNGAGKSSLLEAAVFALTGAKGMRNLDAFIRQGCEECRVALTFSTGGETYRLTRTRSNRGSGKSTLELARQDESGLWAAEGTGATATDDRVRQILGVDEKTLLQTAIVAQGDAGSFFALAAAERLQSLGRILKLDERFGPLERQFKAQADTAKTNLEQDRRDVDRLEGDVYRLGAKEDLLAIEQVHADLLTADCQRAESACTVANDALSTARDAAAGYELAIAKRDEVLKRKNDLEERAGNLNDEYDGLMERVMQREELEAALAGKDDLETARDLELQHREQDRATDGERRRLDQSLTTARARLDEATEEYRQAGRREHAVEDALRAANVAHENAVRAQDALRMRLIQVQDAELPICDRCGQPVTGDALESTLQGLERELSDAFARQDATGAVITAKTSDLAEAAGAVQDARDRGQERRKELESAERGLAALPAPLHDPFGLTSLEHMLTSLAEIPAKLATIATLEERLAVVDVERKAVMAQLEDPALVDDLVDTEGAVREAQGARAAVTAAEIAVRDAETALRGARQSLSEAERAAARLEGEVASLAPCREQLAETQTAAKTHEQEQADADLLRKAMGKWGVPALIVGNVLLSLEVEVNELLALYQMGLALRFESERETGSGARDSLEIVCFDGEAWRPLESFSGGEKYRFASAMRIGLSFLLAHRTGSRVQTLVLDEPEGLDVAGRANLVRLLERASEQFPLVLMMSHFSDLQEAFPSQILVSRGADGLSHAEVVA